MVLQVLVVLRVRWVQAVVVDQAAVLVAQVVVCVMGRRVLLLVLSVVRLVPVLVLPGPVPVLVLV